jgi:protein-S-isoprenylcysteine O-methyltransferase Ste14
MGSHSPVDANSTRPRVARGVIFLFSICAWLGIFVLAPCVVGRRDVKAGWRRGRPSSANRVGMIPLGLGAAGLGWCLTVHYTPGEKVAVSLVPEDLSAKGPYRRSRNPMYLCEQALLLGWTIYFGSPRILAGQSLLAGAMRYAVSREERTLEARFGDSWREYASKVPRWI